jgi:hypothetical protein
MLCTFLALVKLYFTVVHAAVVMLLDGDVNAHWNNWASHAGKGTIYLDKHPPQYCDTDTCYKSLTDTTVCH